MELEEGVRYNTTIFGVTKKKAKTLRDQLPLPVHAIFADRDGYTTIFFQVDDEVLN